MHVPPTSTQWVQLRELKERGWWDQVSATSELQVLCSLSLKGKTYNFTDQGQSVSADDFDAHWAWSGVCQGGDHGHGSDDEEAGVHDEWFDGLGVVEDRSEIGIWLCEGVAVSIVDVIVMIVVECDFSRTSWEGRVFYIHEMALWRSGTCSLSDSGVLLGSTGVALTSLFGSSCVAPTSAAAHITHYRPRLTN